MGEAPRHSGASRMRRVFATAARLGWAEAWIAVVDARRSRLGVKEALFRTVNERIEELNESFATVTERFEIVCECGDPGCITRISMTKPAYEHVRADPALFIVAPGHVLDDQHGRLVGVVVANAEHTQRPAWAQRDRVALAPGENRAPVRRRECRPCARA